VSAFNFFASLVDPSAVVAHCEQSPAIRNLARQRHSADRPGRKQNAELVSWDAAVDEGKSPNMWRAKNLSTGADTLAAELLEPVAA
jgi:hypothetical protein